MDTEMYRNNIVICVHHIYVTGYTMIGNDIFIMFNIETWKNFYIVWPNRPIIVKHIYRIKSTYNEAKANIESKKEMEENQIIYHHYIYLRQ
ncbi:hypothetical protein DERP_015319, partial [Dermatophagoides pteronyssinus]